MSVDAADWGRWRQAVALTETADNPRLWGDSGLAVGRWQMHPVFVDRWWPDAFNTTDTTSWDDLFEVCLKNFFDQLRDTAQDANMLAAWFHEHGGPGPVTDLQYVSRFARYWGNLTP